MAAVVAALASRAAAEAPRAAGDPGGLASEDVGDQRPDTAPERELELDPAAFLAASGGEAGPAPGHARSSRWGRLELAVVWRRSLGGAAAADPSRRGELWLLASWSR